MSHSYKYIIYLGFCVAILFSQCAQVGSPTGGLSDETPPQVSSSYPKNESVNFMGDEVEIEFDEFIQLSDIKNQLIISPSLTEKPEILLKGKKIIIKFNEELRENTTYSLNFGEGIKDYNAGNTARNLTLAFSTGPTLDSLSISGMAVNTFTTEPMQYVKVMLYAALEDSLPLTTKPLYFAQTAEDGTFSINYLPVGTYKCFALDELDGNFIYDQPEEVIGFLNEPLNLPNDSTSIDSLKIQMFNEVNDLGYITKLSTDSLGRFKVEFNQAQLGVRAFQNGTYQELPQYLSKKRDTLYLFTQTLEDVYLERYDSTFSNALYVKDTLELSELNDEHLLGVSKPLQLTPAFSRAVVPNSELLFKTSAPISGFTSSVEVFENDSIPMANVAIEQVDEFHLKLITLTSKEGKFKGLVLPGSASSEYSLPNDSTRFSYNIMNDRELGEIMITLELEIENPLILLMNAKGVLVSSHKLNSERVLTLSNLKPDKYIVYSVNDLDENGKFTPGNYELVQQPERVYKFPQEIEARANWSQNFTWR